MDKRAMKGEETYRNILNSTLDIISKEGIGGVSAAKVSQGAGISKSSVFHHFKSVNEILTAALNKMIDIMVNEVRSVQSSTLADMLHSFEGTLFNESEDFKKLERVFLAFYSESMFQKAYKEIFNKFLADTKNELIKALVRVGLQKENAKKLAQIMIAVLDGLGIQMILTNERSECYESWLEFKTMVLEFYTEG